jgi:hypothetical protein
VGLTDGLTGVGRNPSGSYSNVVMFTAGGGDALLVTAGGIGVSQRFNSCDNGESAYSERDRNRCVQRVLSGG